MLEADLYWPPAEPICKAEGAHLNGYKLIRFAPFSRLFYSLPVGPRDAVLELFNGGLEPYFVYEYR